MYNTSQCLHPESLKMWEEKLEGQRTVPTLKSYLDWLETRITILESTQEFCSSDNRRPKVASKTVHAKWHQQKDPIKTLYTLKSEFQCIICKRNHMQTRCDELSRMSVSERKKIVQKHKLCSNCLQMHETEQCPFNATCKKCTGNHHTLLHDDPSKILLTQNELPLNAQDGDVECDAMSEAYSEHMYHVSINSSTLLATAVVPLRWNGRSVLVRALVDLGATANVVSERACKMLNMPIRSIHIPMTGVGDTPVGRSTGFTLGTIGSIHDKEYSLNIASIVVKTIATTSQIELVGAQ